MFYLCIQKTRNTKDGEMKSIYEIHNESKLNYESSENARVANSIVGLTVFHANKPAESHIVLPAGFKVPKGVEIGFFCKLGDVAVTKCHYTMADLKKNDFANTFLKIVEANTNEKILKKTAFWAK